MSDLRLSFLGRYRGDDKLWKATPPALNLERRFMSVALDKKTTLDQVGSLNEKATNNQPTLAPSDLFLSVPQVSLRQQPGRAKGSLTGLPAGAAFGARAPL